MKIVPLRGRRVARRQNRRFPSSVDRLRNACHLNINLSIRPSEWIEPVNEESVATPIVVALHLAMERGSVQTTQSPGPGGSPNHEKRPLDVAGESDDSKSRKERKFRTPVSPKPL